MKFQYINKYKQNTCHGTELAHNIQMQANTGVNPPLTSAAAREIPATPRKRPCRRAEIDTRAVDCGGVERAVVTTMMGCQSTARPSVTLTFGPPTLVHVTIPYYPNFKHEYLVHVDFDHAIYL